MIIFAALTTPRLRHMALPEPRKHL